jgi:hypothetical protein
LLLLAVGLLAHGVLHGQRPFRVLDSFEGHDAEAALPADLDVPAELVIGRLMYPSTVRFSFRYWRLPQELATRLREYLLRGGFLFCDSFFDSRSWAGFEEGLKQVFPDRPIIDLSDDHPVFHIVYDLPNMTTVQNPEHKRPHGQRCRLPRGWRRAALAWGSR